MVKRTRTVPTDVDELLRKHAVTSQEEFLERRTVPNPSEKNQEKKVGKLVRSTTLSKWGGMSKGSTDNEAKQALKLLKWSNYLSGSAYKRPQKEKLPEYYEFGQEVGSKTDINKPYERTTRRKTLASSLVKSILKTEAAARLLSEHQAEKQQKVDSKEKSRLRKNKAKRNAKKRKRTGM
eukprot:TRINITY_DN14802_c0_g1_i1.p1 TRINITY_DN14802_c0_g1~~TRINITY_DN14802_c0_g1_i1.p1  ORF type:complete len:197 (+),score=57.57 TRINITY_DN14802_c0_g1_i1:55-591(+)